MDYEIMCLNRNNYKATQFLDLDDFWWSVCPRLRDEKTWTETISKHWHFMCIYKIDTEEIVGTITLHSTSERNRRADLWIIIFSNYWNQGIGTKATRLILQYAFELQGFHKIRLSVWVDNIGGIRCYEKCGFKHIWIHKDHFWNYDHYVDMIDMEILVTEYKILREEWFK
jgi:RimJ/RimL family protein N-acetyltransferase